MNKELMQKAAFLCIGPQPASRQLLNDAGPTLSGFTLCLCVLMMPPP